MSKQSRRLFPWRILPVVCIFISEWQAWREEQTKPGYRLAPIPGDASKLSPYPIDMWPLLALPHGALDEAGVPYNAPTRMYPAAYHPTTIAQYALAHWNAYLETGDEKHRLAFMTQARWLVAHEVLYADDRGGWPMPFASYEYNALKSWLSALTQGNGISVLVRAYQLTGEDVFLQGVRQAIHTFELDIHDGGVSTSVGNDGIFFEEVAAYPTAHILNGYIFSLFGLYDYVALTDDAQIAALIQRSLVTMHTLIDQFDIGYWSRYDLLYRHPASRFYHDLHSTLLEALASYSGCTHCVALAARWVGYQHSLRCRLCYFIVSRIVRYCRQLRRVGIRGAFLQILGTEGQTMPSGIRTSITVPPVAHLSSIEKEGNS